MIRLQGDVLHVEGAMTFAEASGLLAPGRSWVAGGGGVVDMGAVTVADSAGLAVLLDWLRLAAAEGRSLRLVGVPPAIKSLARLYDLDAFLASDQAEPA